MYLNDYINLEINNNNRDYGMEMYKKVEKIK
jgi:hypothetical protein